MRIPALAAALAVAVSSAGVAGLVPSRGVLHYADVPVRPHVALGPVQALARPEADALHPAPSLAEAARARYGRVDAIAGVRAAALPAGEGAVLTGAAIRWK